MLSHLHGLDEGDVFGSEGVEGGQSSLQCRESLRQVPLTLVLDGLRLCSCFVGHCLICSNHLKGEGGEGERGRGREGERGRGKVYVCVFGGGGDTTACYICLHVHQFPSLFLLPAPSLPLPSLPLPPSLLLPDLFLCLCLDSVSFNLHHELLCLLLSLHQLWLQFLELLLHHRHL